MVSPLLLVFMLSTFYTSSSAHSFSFSSFNSAQTPVASAPDHFKDDGSPNASVVPSNGHVDKKPLGKFDLKIFLLVLWGLDGIGATSIVSGPLASTNVEEKKPVEPDFLSCKQTSILGGRTCCPPLVASKEINDFKLPPKPKSLRVRPPAHMVTDDYVSKLKMAINIMKALPDEDPRSFNNLANVHCAYCEGYYSQVGFPDLELKIHYSWLFFPFHRAYLYFVERIMGDLIQDPNFAIPFWNWDTPSGMTIPPIYIDKESPLYDDRRDPRHQPPVFVDFDYEDYYNTTGTTPSTMTNDKQREINLAVMYRNLVSGSKIASLFMGSPYIAGQKGEPGGGLIEYAPHNPVHSWVGNHAGEDMGYFYSAGRDPLFYSHHANVDRMWSLWKSLPGGRKDLNDPAWLNSSFLFYNEKKELVRIKVRDCLETEKLGYRYEDVATPWMRKSFKTHNNFKAAMKKRKFRATDGEMVKDMVFPRLLDKAIKVMVPKPTKKRSEKEKEGEEEVLVIQGIELNKEMFVKFDVLINCEGDEHTCRADQKEFVGSFINLPRKHHHVPYGPEKLKTSQKIGISELLEDLGAEEDDHVEVMLVPRSKNGRVSIDGIKIILES